MSKNLRSLNSTASMKPTAFSSYTSKNSKIPIPNKIVYKKLTLLSILPVLNNRLKHSSINILRNRPVPFRRFFSQHPSQRMITLPIHIPINWHRISIINHLRSPLGSNQVILCTLSIPMLFL